ncbi:sensor domain-containing diguanylate cyclase [Metabacillus endolithicus]|uniref:sensor domain-containing diguanylate cyclase n=1 Tax=Metabacillus endolithicus TaxID=1535204 RepID=UPI002490AAEE|nr:sensor domain-containing diguanylate cyclase [Metabacillus endolithicus]
MNGKSLYYNPAARNMLGICEEDHHSHSVTDWWLTDLPKTEGIPIAIEKGHWKGEALISKQDGTKIPVSQMIVAHKSENGTVEFLSTIAHDITERKELEKVVYTQAHYDDLTNLPNRRYLHKKLTELMDSTGNKRFAMIFMDLDNFKDINDSLGHDSGDQLLKMIATKLEACVEDNDFVSRYGGDEFIIVLEIAHHNFKIKKIEEQIIKLFQQPFLIGGNTVKVTGSMGISIFPDDGTDFDILLKKADTAMYQIKKDGKKNLY